VVNFLGTDAPPGGKALLAQRARRDVHVSDDSPAAAIDFIAVWMAIPPVVLACVLLGVFLAKPPRHQLRAAGIGAGLLWFVWHKVPSVRANQKPPDCSEGFCMNFY